MVAKQQQTYKKAASYQAPKGRSDTLTNGHEATNCDCDGQKNRRTNPLQKKVAGYLKENVGNEKGVEGGVVVVSSHVQ